MFVKIDDEYFNPNAIIRIFEKSKDNSYWREEVLTIIVTHQSCSKSEHNDSYVGIRWPIEKVIDTLNKAKDFGDK